MELHFREAANIGELDALLQMRYQVYASDDRLAEMVSTRDRYDINYFDERALHFGGFMGNTPVAYMRMTTLTPTKFSPWIKEIANANHIALHPNGCLFPFENYSPDKQWNKDFLASLDKKRIGEVGKLAIRPEYRKSGVVLSSLIKAFVHHCHEYEFDTGFGSCTLPLERYYRQFGFVRAKGAQPFMHKQLPPAVMVVFNSKEVDMNSGFSRSDSLTFS